MHLISRDRFKREPKQRKTVNASILLSLLILLCILAACNEAVSENTPQATPTQKVEAAASVPTIQALIAPGQTVTRPPEPPIGGLPIVGENDGWTTYRNDIIGYEISAPQDFKLGGELPEVGCDLLGPGMPCDALQNLLRQYYGDSLCIGIGKAQTAWFFGIEAYDIVQNHLDSWCFGTGVGDYELVNAEQSIYVEGQAQKLTTTILMRDQVQVGETSFLLLQNKAIRIMFGFSPTYPEIPEDYQAYVKNVRPELVKMIQSFKSIPTPESQ